MENRPAVWNGVKVPYSASIDELVRLIDGPAPACWAAFVALAHVPGNSALAVLRESTASSNPHVRRIAVEAIGVHHQGHRLGKVIRSLLSDPHPFVVRSACEAAFRQRSVEAHDSIVRLLDADEDSTRVAALRALRGLWQQADFEKVLRVFTSYASGEVRNEAAWTLRSVASATNWDQLFALWRVDPLPRHREWASELALHYGSREVVPELRHLAEDADGHVRKSAARAVQELEARRYGAK
jgi:HEAT repeat protein